MNTTDSLRSAFAPTGRLRASINLGNPILANRNAATHEVGGVSVDLARELAQRLGLPLDLVVFDAAGKSVEAVTAEQADFGFFAVDPVRGQGIAQSLLQWAENRAGQLGCCKLTLEILSNNIPAMRSYQRAGFEPYVLDPAAGHALLMQKYLQEI